MTTDQLLSLGEVSEMTGLAKPTLYGMRSRGDGPPSFRVQGRVKYRKSAVEQWLKDQEEKDPLNQMNRLRAV